MSRVAYEAVDFDGTLVRDDQGWEGPDVITGDVIPEMVEFVRQRIQLGKRYGFEMRIFTARVSDDGTAAGIAMAERARLVIENFCLEQFGQKLAVTNKKCYGMLRAYCDRSVQIVPNTGRRADGRGLHEDLA